MTIPDSSSDDLSEGPIGYRAALDFLYERVNYEKQGNRPYSETHYKLDRMRKLLQALENPHLGTPVIHIAGTKGKGSTATMIASVAMAAGIRTGLYTSPHLVHLEERFTVDGKHCPPDLLVTLVDQLREATAALQDDLSDRPTFFELTTALAWLYFRSQNVELIVLEVGLGGRLDSTNVCDPTLTIITSISLDHQAQLGNTLSQIATEKAGIIKPGVPLICGVRSDEPRETIHAIARDRGVEVRQLGREFDVQWQAELVSVDGEPRLGGLIDFSYALNNQGVDPSLRQYRISMPGKHQSENAAIAIAAIDWLNENVQTTGMKTIGNESIETGLLRARARGRIEIVSDDPLRIIDTAHNPASMQALTETLEDYFPDRRRVVIFAASRDKEVPKLLEEIAPRCQILILTQYCESPRAVPVDQLREIMRNVSQQMEQQRAQRLPLVVAAADPEEAWEMGLQLSGADDLLCATGSFFLAAELIPVLGSKRFENLAEETSSRKQANGFGGPTG